MLYNVDISYSGKKRFMIEANHSSDAERIARQEFVCLDSQEIVDSLDISVEDCWSSYLEKAYHDAARLDMEEPDSNSGIYAIARCMDSGEFVEALDKCKNGIAVGEDLLITVAKIVYCVGIRFAYVSKSDPRDWEIKQRAIAAAKILKPHFEWDWDYIIESGNYR